MLIVARWDDLMGQKKRRFKRQTDTDDFLVRLRLIKLFFLKVCRSGIADLSTVSDV